MRTWQPVVEVPPKRPKTTRIHTPSPQPWFMRPTLEKEAKGETHVVRFEDGGIVVDGRNNCKVTSTDGLVQFMRDIHPGYYQDEADVAMRLTSVLSNSQKEDLRVTQECDLGDGNKLVKMGYKFILKEAHGERYRNYILTNVMPGNDGVRVSDEDVAKGNLKLAWKLETSGLYLPGAASKGGLSRALVVEKAGNAYFPLWLLDKEELSAFYASIKGPTFRNFVEGDSYDCTDSDLKDCYAYILRDSISASPDFCRHFKGSDYQPEAAYCSALIWIDLVQMGLTPLGVRVSKLLFDEDSLSIDIGTLIVHPWGRIEQVRVNMPMLWFLVEKLKLRLGKDLGIIDAWWVVPEGRTVYAWREWSRLVRQAIHNFGELKYLGQMGVTGGIYQKMIKIDEGEYEGRWEGLSTENPLYMSHLFEMTKVLTLLGASQSSKVKGFAADGWVCKGRTTNSIGPVKIGAVTYGPFPVVNTPLELYFQFDPIRHDKIEDFSKDDGMWRSLVEAQKGSNKLRYEVDTPESYKENWEEPDVIGKVRTRKFEYEPNMGENIPEKKVERIGDLLGEEVPGKAPHTSEVHTTIEHVNPEYYGDAKYA